MFYETAADWRRARQKRVALFGMSGLGKTRLSAMLREEAAWFHYSVDFRIGTRYMGEHIVDNFKREAMQPVPAPAPALGFDLHRLQHHLPEPRRRSRPISASRATSQGRDRVRGIPAPAAPAPRRRDRRHPRRAELHREGRARSTATTISSATPPARSARWSTRSTRPTRCSPISPSATLPVWIRGTEAHLDELARRFDKAPKPMYYPEAFLTRLWSDYLAERRIEPGAGRPRRLHPPRLPGADVAPAAALPAPSPSAGG